MKQPFFTFPRALAMQAIMTLCIGLGCAYPLLAAMGIPIAFSHAAALCAAITAFLSAFRCLPRLRFLSYPLLLAALAMLLRPYFSQAASIGAALTLMVNGQPLALAAYAQPITYIVCVVLTGIGSGLADDDHAFFPLVLLTLGMLFAASFLGVNIGASSILPLLLALLLAARAGGVSPLRIIPGAALVLALTMLLVPYSASTAPQLRELAQRVRERIDDYFFFTDPRTTFSLNSAGWQPLGTGQLGGPVNPADDPVMEVRTSQRALLRGTIKNLYTGLSWQDTASGRRYLFVSPRFMQMKRDLFDQARPARRIRDALGENEKITVSMLAESASTLYVTQRFSALRGSGIVPYFSPSTELFGTRSLAPGDSYTFSGSLITAATGGIRSAVLEAYDPQDPYYESVQSAYLQLPHSVDSRVYALADQLTRGERNAFDRAAAICEYLQSSFPYTLNQSQPPLTQDFVSWFLFEEQQGYCTSFATAMAVLARAAGLPARYIEGYAAVPDEDGVARVTQQYAHAWTELYFPGFGWLAFDATPGSSSGSPGEGSPGAGDAQNPNAPDAPDDDSSDAGNQDNDSQASPDGETPSPSPTPSPTPTPSPVPTPTPSPTPVHDDPDVTPTPPITPQPTSVPTPTPQPTMPPTPPEDDDPSDFLQALIIALILLLLAVLCAVRAFLTSPSYLAAACRNPGDALLVWYAASMQALAAMGITLQPGEAPATFLARAQDVLGGKVRLMPMGRALCAARYSRHRLKDVHAQRAEESYRQLLTLLTPLQRIRMHLYRFRFSVKAE